MAQQKKSSFFRHTQCEQFPCHKGLREEDFNCIFCFCPLYTLGDKCGGSYCFTEKGVKDCSRCTYPHERGNFDAIMERFPELSELAKKNCK